MVRVILGGPGLDGFEMPDATDAYVNVAIPPAGAPYDASVRAAGRAGGARRGGWPIRRRYTVRTWDETNRRLTLDFAAHGDDGVAGPWAATVAPGDVLVFEGPGSGIAPTPPPTGACWSATSPPCRPSPRRSRPSPRARRSWSGWSATARSTRCRSTPPARWTSSGCTAPVTPSGTPSCSPTRRRRGLPGRPGPGVRARRGRRDPDDPPSPPDRARPEPRGHVVLAVLAPHHDRRGLAPGQARLRGRHGSGRRLTHSLGRTGDSQVGPRGRSGQPPMLSP